jgi:hypothetical protein
MNKTPAMHTGWCAIFLAGWLAGWLAGCTSPTSPSEASKPVPDRFNDNLDVMMRSVAHPCGADLDYFDGQIVVHYGYVYDALGRVQSDIGKDPTGALYERVDYTWDNAGHLTNQQDAIPGAGSLMVITSLYDTLGRLTRMRSTASDTDAADDHQNANTRSTIDYTNFDVLGHAADSSELREDLDARTSRTLNTSYSHDDLGRLTSSDTHLASGELVQSVQLQYDDAALTVTSQINAPQGVGGTTIASIQSVSHYDGDGHWLSTHLDNGGTNGAVATTTDVAVAWDGDRDVEERTTLAPVDHAWQLHISKTYKYECDSARLASAPQGVSALPEIPRALLHLHP